MKAVVRNQRPPARQRIPAANGVATARGLARMYGALASGGRMNGTSSCPASSPRVWIKPP